VSRLKTERIPLATGITLNVCHGGPEGAEALLFLHGFPESHRTWRHQLADLSSDFRVVAADQRGFAGSDKPEGAESYETARVIEDALALMDKLGIERFTLVGHDWGGAVAWAMALQHPDRVERLVIVNAPHPLVLQKSLIEDEEQRRASQYISFFRNPAAEAAIIAMGIETFLEKVMLAHADVSKLPEEERRRYLDDWSEPGALTAMLNWYRASKLVVPAPGESAHLPLWTLAPFPKVAVPTLVVWGLKDSALRPVQLHGLHEQVEDLRIVTAPGAGHFITWEEPELVAAAIRDFVVETGG
jgi:pimeloyl-ACP methyl ester carboxylesterase